MPEPKPSPPPTTLPGSAQVNKARTVVDRLPGMSRLPDDVKPVVREGLLLLVIVITYLALRQVVIRSIKNGMSTVVAREQAAGNAGRAARLRTLASLSTSIILYTMGFVFLVSALTIIDINVAGIIGTAGVAGLAFGFGAQKLVKDVITGFFILLEDQYAVGDYVTINAITGTVEELAMRTTRLRDDDGKLYILSNGDIAQVCNQSRGPVAGNFEIAIAASADVQQATEKLNAALTQISEEMGLARVASVEGISQADSTKTTLKVSFQARGSERPAAVALHLREAARTALLNAQIPLG